MNADDTRILALEGVEAQGKHRHFSLEADLPRLEEVLADNDETRLVVIDPIAAYCGAVDSHKNSDVRGLLAPLAELAGRHRVAIVSVTHLSKSGGTKAVYRAMRSLALAAAARTVWAVTKDADDPRRRLFLPAKLNLATDPDGLACCIDGGRVAWEPDPVIRTRYCSNRWSSPTSPPACREDIPLYHGHEVGFIRIALHLCHRAQQLGFDIYHAAVCAGHRYGLSHASLYAEALGDEPARCTGMSFREIKSFKPPQAFSRLWTVDFIEYHQRFPLQKGLNP